MTYVTKFSQNVTSDANNSSQVNWAHNDYFIGTPTSTLGVAGLQVCLHADQACTLWVEQSHGLTTGVGTVTTTNSGPTGIITGSAATKFTRDFKVGDQIYVAGESVHTISVITSDTVMNSASTFSGVSGVAYQFYPWDESDQYNYVTTIDNFGVTVQAVNAYVRVRVTNIGTATTGVFRLDTVLCPIVEALPRALDENGNLKISMGMDTYGWELENTPQGDARSITPVRLAGVSFEGNTLDPNFWSTINQNGGTVTQNNGRVDVLTNTSANGSATLFTNRKGRYVVGSANLCRIQARVGDTGTADNTRKWGAGLGSTHTLTISSASVVAGDVYTDISGVQYTILITGTVTTATVFATGTPTAGARTYTRVSGTGAATLTGSGFAVSAILTDGFYFQLSGTTFSVGTIIGGSPTVVNSGDFNGNMGSYYTPTTGVTTWEIYYNTKTTYFSINGILLHSVSNALTPLSNTLTLYAFLQNTNSGGSTTNVGLYCRSLSIRRLGLLETEKAYKYIATNTTTICKYGAGRLNKVIWGDPDSAQIVTLYDGMSTAAPIIHTLTNVASGNQHSKMPASTEFGCPFYNGLTVTTSTTAPINIIYE